MTTILDRIWETKRREVAAASCRRPIALLREEIAHGEPPRDFFSAITAESPAGIKLIAEIKKASPLAGVIVEDFDPQGIARIYHKHGAAAISVLTDETYFQGRLEHIQLVKEAAPLPVLRKDFIVDEYQIYEARAAGADAVLLIAEGLEGQDKLEGKVDPEAKVDPEGKDHLCTTGAERIAELWAISHELGMATLIEVHTEQSLSAVLDRLGPSGRRGYILGINNRNLTTRRTDLTTTVRLAPRLPKSTPFVTESGIATRDDVRTVQHAGACAMLVGESLLRADDIGARIDVLLGKEV